jgi:molybdenum cofactor cytidylyltransferase
VVGAVVLAAGASTRMGRTKVLLPLGSGTILSTVVERVRRSSVGRLVLVLGHDADRVRKEALLPPDPRTRIVVNPSWAQGMASSVREGIRACADCEAAVLALGDQPGVDPEVIERLIQAWRAGAPLAVPVHEGRLGHPVLFDSRLFAALQALEGDRGAREVVKSHWAEAAQVPASPLGDLDTPSDYEALLAGLPVAKSEGLEMP